MRRGERIASCWISRFSTPAADGRRVSHFGQHRAESSRSERVFQQWTREQDACEPAFATSQAGSLLAPTNPGKSVSAPLGRSPVGRMDSPLGRPGMFPTRRELVARATSGGSCQIGDPVGFRTYRRSSGVGDRRKEKMSGTDLVIGLLPFDGRGNPRLGCRARLPLSS